MKKKIIGLFLIVITLTIFAPIVYAANTATISITECLPDDQGANRPVLNATWNLNESVSSENQCNIYIDTPSGPVHISNQCNSKYKSPSPGFIIGTAGSQSRVSIEDAGTYRLIASTGTCKEGFNPTTQQCNPGGYIETVVETQSVPQYCDRIPNPQQNQPKTPLGGGIANIEQVFGQITPPSFIQNIGSGEEGISKILTVILSIIYVVSGIVFAFMIVWSAWQWMTSGGEKDKVAAARQRLTYAIVGIVILALAASIITLLGNIIGFKFFS